MGALLTCNELQDRLLWCLQMRQRDFFRPILGREVTQLRSKNFRKTADKIDTMKVKNKNVALGSVIVTCGFLIVMFQNMTLVEFTTLNMPEIDEGSRQDQARELLGAFYNGSVVQ